MSLTLYHGSESGLNGSISPHRSHGTNDFGRGFYMGTEPSQPKTLICDEAAPVLYTLDFNLDGLKVYRFETNYDWAFFVAFNRGKLERYADTDFYRRYQRIRSEHDVIFGKIANDRMFTVMGMFFQGLIGDTALFRALSALNIGDQYCAVTEAACDPSRLRITDEKRFCVAELDAMRSRAENQRRRGSALADQICKQYRREGYSLDEIAERLRKEEKDAADQC